MSIDKSTLQQAIPRLANKHILVLGDVLLDEYLIGQASRLSREAPIPVLEFERRQTIPGGAANPAMNIVALGSHVKQIGLIGADDIGVELQTALQAAKINTDGLVLDASRLTTQKTRIVSQGGLRFPQQVARLDRIDRRPPAPPVIRALVEQIQQKVAQVQAILISDYGNGLLTPFIIQTALHAAKQHNILVVVDSQGRLSQYLGCDIIRANDRDTALYLNRSLKTEADFQTAIKTLLDKLGAKGIVIGRGGQGVSIQGQSTPYTHFRATNPSEVYDVTGAGDTFSAVLTLGLVSDLGFAEATLLANYAAGLVVRKLGNATLSPQELEEAINRW